ncbi:Prepro-urotensin II-gamma [Triplophysa tibetana]|uniref:Prepro-urotensin II-gamma n=1 Tax=Triplophysa tibetana TaxID=1572043 RepID=A0A5A9NDS7_9TELE|nr:Prepro-urotensin II-gamma [Triplophysa tibetana]
MMCHLILSCFLLIFSCSPLLAHPITDTAEMTYVNSDSVEEAGAFGPDDFSVADLNDLLQRATVGLPSLLSRDGIKTSGQVPRNALKEVLLEKPYRLMPASSLWSRRRQFRKRGSSADCFWKYCV